MFLTNYLQSQCVRFGIFVSSFAEIKSHAPLPKAKKAQTKAVENQWDFGTDKGACWK